MQRETPDHPTLPATKASSIREWWKEEPLSILELADPLHVAAHGREGFDPKRVSERMHALNATAAHVFPMGCHLDGEVLFFRHRSPTDPPMRFDYLGEWLEHSTAAGVRTIVYFNVHSVKGPYARKHPDWQQCRFDGSAKDDVYTIESTFCVNSPWRQWVFDRLRELCEYPIDGVFFDGPVFFPDCCYCKHCHKQFHSRCGEVMPRSDALSDPLFAEWVAFRSDSIAAFVRESRDIIKTARPGALFYCNANPLQPSRLTARDNRKLADCQDILASEGGFLGGDLLTDSPIWKVGLNAKLLETESAGMTGGAAGVPHLVFDSVIHTPWTYSTLPAAEARLLWASSVAHGAGTWMSAYKDAMDRPALSAVGELYAFARRERESLAGSSSLAEVALVCSANTMNFYGAADVARTDVTARQDVDRAGNVTRELYGWYQALWTAHVPFDVLDDVSLEGGDLARYRAIVLPNTACMTDAAADALRQFVNRGGTLIGSFECGLYDERGRRRRVAALDDLFGIRRAENLDHAALRRWDYLFDHRAGKSGIDAVIPSPSFALPIVTAPGAESLLTFSTALADRYAGLPGDSGAAALVRRDIGAGRTFYFACDFGAAVWKWRMPEHLALAKEALGDAAAGLLQMPKEAPPCLDLSLRRSRDHRSAVLHLVNYNGGMTRPIERVLPVPQLAIRVRLRASAARALFSASNLEVKPQGEWTSVRLPLLNEYEAIRFEL